MQTKYSKQFEEVLSFAAAKAARNVPGVSRLVQAPLQRNLRAKEYYHGVLIVISDDGIEFDIYINVLLGTAIPVLAFAVQEAVKKAIEGLTKHPVNKINVHVQGVNLKNYEEN